MRVCAPVVLLALAVLLGGCGMIRIEGPGPGSTRGPGPGPGPGGAEPGPPPSAGSPTLQELDELASRLLREDDSGRRLQGRIVDDAGRSSGIASITWSGDDSIIFVHPERRRTWSTNTWAFIIGHELAHVILDHREAGRRTEREADAYGAQLAHDAGYDVAGYIEFICSMPNLCGPTHGCWHRRVKRLEDQFGVEACGGQVHAGIAPAMAVGLPYAEGGPCILTPEEAGLDVK